MAKTKNVTLYIPQGSTYTHVFTYLQSDESTPVNLTGYTARMQIRKKITSTTTELECTTANTKLSIPTPANGQVILKIPDTDTSAFTFIDAVFDIEIISSGGDVTRLVEGKIKVDKEVTR